MLQKVRAPLFVLLFSLLMLVLAALPQEAIANSWGVGNTVGLCQGAEIRTGSGLSYPVHTVVPENGWEAVVTGGPRSTDGHTWWDISRAATGDPSGGTGWVIQSQNEDCPIGGGGGDDGGGGSDDGGNTSSTPQTYYGRDEGLWIYSEGWEFWMDITYLDVDAEHYLIQKVALHTNRPTETFFNVADVGLTIYSDNNEIWSADTNQLGENFTVIGADQDVVYEVSPDVTVSKQCNELLGSWVHSHHTIIRDEAPSQYEYPYPNVIPEIEGIKQEMDELSYTLPPSTFDTDGCKSHENRFDVYATIIDSILEAVRSNEIIKGVFEVGDRLPFNIQFDWPGSDIQLILTQPDGTQLDFNDPDIIYRKTPTTLSVTVLEPQLGLWKIDALAVDMATEGEPVHLVIRDASIIDADITSPITTANVQGTEGNSGWYVSPVTVLLSASDDRSGVAATYYSIDGGEFVTGTSVPLTSGGIYTVRYYSEDAAGNVEGVQKMTVKVDTSPPVITISAPEAAAYTRCQSPAIDFNVTDNLSGVDWTAAHVDEHSVANGDIIDMLWWDLGDHTLAVDATDIAGNQAGESVTFQLQATIDGMQCALDRFYASGHVGNRGVYNGLSQKLNVAEAALERGQDKVVANVLRAFIKESEAQAGKHVAPGASGILTGDAAAIRRGLQAR